MTELSTTAIEAMNWTKDQPKSGWHWVRYPGSIPMIVRGDEVAKGGYSYECEFLGPITPEDTEKVAELQRGLAAAREWFEDFGFDNPEYGRSARAVFNQLDAPRGLKANECPAFQN